MKFYLIIVLVACLSCWLTPADSTEVLGAKIAAGVKGIKQLGSSVKGKIVKGVQTLLTAKKTGMQNIVSALADVEQEPSTTVAMEEPTYVIYEQSKPWTFRLLPVDVIPTEVYTTGHWPFERHSMGIRTVKLPSTKMQEMHSKIAQFKKNSLLGLFNKLQSVVGSKKKTATRLLNSFIEDSPTSV